MSTTPTCHLPLKQAWRASFFLGCEEIKGADKESHSNVWYGWNKLTDITAQRRWTKEGGDFQWRTNGFGRGPSVNRVDKYACVLFLCKPGRMDEPISQPPFNLSSSSLTHSIP
jgi:hypothetical protein